MHRTAAAVGVAVVVNGAGTGVGAVCEDGRCSRRDGESLGYYLLRGRSVWWLGRA